MNPSAELEVVRGRKQKAELNDAIMSGRAIKTVLCLCGFITASDAFEITQSFYQWLIQKY